MDASNKLLELIRDIVKDNTNRLDKSVICMVESVNADGTVNIRLPSDIDNIINNIPNNSAYKFEYGDYAVLYKMENRLNNAFIIAKVTKDSPEFNIIQTYNFNGTSGGSLRGITDMQVNGLSVVNNGIGNIVTTTTYNESNNKITTEDFVNSSIATNTANFIGTFQNVTALNDYSGTVTNNDYAFVVNSVVQYNSGDFPDVATLNAYDKTLLTNFDYAWVVNSTDNTKFDLYRFDIVDQTWYSRATAIAKDASLLNTAYNRYKSIVSGSTIIWSYEYTLNNSSFTAAQWAAINSGISAGNYVTTVNGNSGTITVPVASINTTSGSESVTVNSNTLNVVTRNTAQSISGIKTFTNGIKLARQSSIWNTANLVTDDGNEILGVNTNGQVGFVSNVSDSTVLPNAFTFRNGTTNLFRIGNTSIRPESNNSYDCGTSANKWRYVFAGTKLYTPKINNGADISVPATSGTMALTSDIPDDGTITATPSKNIKRDASGNANAVAFNLCTSGTDTAQASMQYNSANESIEFIFV